MKERKKDDTRKHGPACGWLTRSEHGTQSAGWSMHLASLHGSAVTPSRSSYNPWIPSWLGVELCVHFPFSEAS